MNQSPLFPAALEARRSKAQHSTGPRTEAGKNRSRLNALTHGGFASGLAWTDQSLRALGEDPEEFRKLVAGLRAAEGPASDPLWELQLEDLARLYWRRRRLERAWEDWAARHVKWQVATTPGTPQETVLLQQLDRVDRSIDRKTRLVLRMREAAERRSRQLERSARGRARQDPENLGDDAVPTKEELAEKEAEILRLDQEIAACERERDRVRARLGQQEENPENTERSGEVVEKTGVGIQDSGVRGEEATS